MFLFYTLNAIRKFSFKKGYPFTGVEDQTIKSIFWFWVFLMVIFHEMQTGVTMLKYHSVTVLYVHSINQ